MTQNEIRRMRVEAGLCRYCKRHALAGLTVCQTHRIKGNQMRKKERFQQRLRRMKSRGFFVIQALDNTWHIVQWNPLLGRLCRYDTNGLLMGDELCLTE